MKLNRILAAVVVMSAATGCGRTPAPPAPVASMMTAPAIEQPYGIVVGIEALPPRPQAAQQINPAYLQQSNFRPDIGRRTIFPEEKAQKYQYWSFPVRYCVQVQNTHEMIVIEEENIPALTLGRRVYLHQNAQGVWRIIPDPLVNFDGQRPKETIKITIPEDKRAFLDTKIHLIIK